LNEALGQGGLTVDDVQVMTVPFKDVPAAPGRIIRLMRLFLVSHCATIAIDKDQVAILSNNFINGFDATYLYMGESLLADKATSQGFMRAYLKACADLQGDYMSPQLAAIMEKYTKVPAAVVVRAATAQYDASGKIPVNDLSALQKVFPQARLARI
jgi:ABC-type nitrate/sulfonate/bicarbonate transport system substrate-binding protein